MARVMRPSVAADAEAPADQQQATKRQRLAAGGAAGERLHASTTKAGGAAAAAAGKPSSSNSRKRKQQEQPEQQQQQQAQAVDQEASTLANTQQQQQQQQQQMEEPSGKAKPSAATKSQLKRPMQQHQQPPAAAGGGGLQHVAAGGATTTADSGSDNKPAASSSRSGSRSAGGRQSTAVGIKPCDRDSPHLSQPHPGVEAATAAAAVSRAHARPGRIIVSTDRAQWSCNVPDVSAYRLGDQTGHHAKLFVWKPESQEPAAADAAEAAAAADDHPSWVQVSTACHDCQYQHIKHKCEDARHTRAATYCSRCLHIRYAATHLTMAELRDVCPLCRGCCTCKACLSNPRHNGEVCVAVAGPEQQRRDGAYLQRRLAPHMQAWLQKQEAEARAGGYAHLADVPVNALDDNDKAFCERCATNLVGLSASCSRCEAECCVDCLRQLREHEQRQQQAQQLQDQQQQQQQAAQRRASLNPLVEVAQSVAALLASKLGSSGAACAAAGGEAGGGSSAVAAAAGGGSSSSGASRAFEWTCWNPKCGMAEPETAAAAAGSDDDDDDEGDEQQRPVSGQQQEQQQQQPHKPRRPLLSGGDCWCRPGAPTLQLQVVLPGDLVVPGEEEEGGSAAGAAGDDDEQQAAARAVMQRLTSFVETTPTAPLSIEDCPLLPPGAQHPLLRGADGQAVTLQQLQAPTWFELLPQPYRDSWRRHAGREGCDKWLFTPHFEDLQHPAAAAAAATAGAEQEQEQQVPGQPEQQQQQEAVQRCALANVLFWARWMLWEPIIVRGCKGRIPWDPHTMVRATKDAKASEARVRVLDCGDLHELPSAAITGHKFFAGFSQGIFKFRGSGLTAGPLHKSAVVVPVTSSRNTAAGGAAGAAAAAARGSGGGSDGGSGAEAAAAAGGSGGSSSSAAAAAGGGGGAAAAAAGGSGGSAAAAAAAAPVSRDVYEGPLMLKVKDWPPTDDFRKDLPRHYMDFVERLPARSITNPRLGYSTLNLASHMLPSDNPTDLGPKCYLAYGRQHEAQCEGDSVTKLHLDMTDAINILADEEAGGDAYVQQRQRELELEQAQQLEQQQQQEAGGSDGAGGGAAEAAAPAAAGPSSKHGVVARCGDAKADRPGYGAAGAVWDLWARGEDTTKLSHWLAANTHKFVHQGKQLSAAAFSGADADALAPVMSHKFMLRQAQRDALFRDTGVAAWHFEQYLEEGVFIPGGCPHQVRNLRSCSKVAVDFMSPEAVSSALQQHQHLRTLDLAHGNILKAEPFERDHSEKLQSHLMLLRGAVTASGMLAQPQVLLQPRPDPSLDGTGKKKKARSNSSSNGPAAAAAAANGGAGAGRAAAAAAGRAAAGAGGAKKAAAAGRRAPAAGAGAKGNSKAAKGRAVGQQQCVGGKAKPAAAAGAAAAAGGGGRRPAAARAAPAAKRQKQ